MPRQLAGYTIPFIPVILINRCWAGQNLAGMPDELVDSQRRIRNPGSCRVAQFLLHEAAHQLFAVWPEWKRWLFLRNIYGPSINAADAISESICRELCISTRYPADPIEYKSPLHWLGKAFRR